MFLNSKILTTLLSALFLWVSFSVISLEVEKQEAVRDKKNIESKVGDARHSNESLEKFIKHFNNRLFVEKDARLRLNYKAPDEEVVFVHRDLNSKTASSSEEFLENKFGIYKKWLSRISSFGF